MEVQIAEEDSFASRTVYYWAKNYQEQLKKGDDYINLEPTICINLLDFIIFPDLEGFHNCFQIREKDKPEYILTEHLQIHFIELVKLRSLTEEDLTDKLLTWCYYFQKEGQMEEENMPVLIKDDKIFQKAHEEYKHFTADDDLMYAMEAREKWLKDQTTRMNSAKREGKLEGKIEGKIEDAKAMLLKGFSVNDIADITGLSIKKIQELTS